MKLDDFRSLLDLCGGSEAAWPPGAREAADRLLARSAEARDELARQQRVDWTLEATSARAGERDFAAEALRKPQLAPLSRSRIAAVRFGRAAIVALAVTAATGLGLAAGAVHAALEEPAQALAAALAPQAEAADVG